MIRKMMRTTVAAAGFAALFLTGACAHNDAVNADTNRVVEVRPDDPAATGVVPGPALADSDGNVYSSSAAPGRGNPATVGTNTNVNHIAAGSSTASTTNMTSSTVDTTSSMDLDTSRDTAPVVTDSTTSTTTTTTRTVDAPMTSSAQESTSTTTKTTETPARTRMRKD